MLLYYITLFILKPFTIFSVLYFVICVISYHTFFIKVQNKRNKNEIQKNINKNIVSLLKKRYNYNWDLSKLQEPQVLYNCQKAVLKASLVVPILSIV